MSNNRKDIILSLVCGELTAWFLLFVVKNPYVTEFKSLAKIGSLIWILPIVFPVVFLIGVLVAQLISRFIKVINQVVRFVEVGILNTFIDVGILNILIWLSGITAGGRLTPLNSISFLCAATNSYFWNKLWTFKKEGQVQGKEFTQFLAVSAVGWLINTLIVVLGTTFFPPIAFLSAGAWVNVMKLVAIFVAMFWNFTGYKFIVFKK